MIRTLIFSSIMSWPALAFAASCAWEVPEEAKGQHLTVKIQASYRMDGSVQSAIIAHDMEPQMANPAFKALAEAALKTVKHCPLAKMPEKDYDKWHFMEFSFDSDDAPVEAQ